MPAARYSVLILGLDGATFDFMLPFIEQGHLPCLASLVARGSRSALQSTIPPITPCAWSSFMTGKNPGKHGLFDFIEPVPNSHGFRFTNATSRHGETLWGHLSRLGFRVGVLNVPMTYPPEKVNGYQISGLDTPDERSPYIYPQGLREELHSETIAYRLDPRHMGNMRNDRRRDAFLRELCDLETVRTRALRFLSRRHPADFRMLVYSATDQVQHHFWQYADPTHEKYDAEGAERYRNAIRDVYVHLDRLIASVLEDEGEDTIVMLMSDHGFGPTSSVRLRLNQTFEREGLLKFPREGVSGRTLRSAAGWLDRLLRSTLSPRIKRFLARVFPRLRVWFESLDEAAPDWTQTTAYTNEVSRCFPAVWLNHVGATEDGTVPPEKLEEALRATEAALTKLRDPRTGGPAISHVYRTRELYEGPYVNKAPDLIPSWWEDGFLLEQSVPGGRAELDAERSTEPIKGGVEFAGNHRLDGIFVAAGGPIRRGHVFTGAEIIDVAPTVLYLMGVPIPGDMDGRPLLEAIDRDFVAQNRPRYEDDLPTPDPEADVEKPYTEEESELIAQRLQALGYME
jgi:predicted AlkP superfamily phosphohydrolase/phosphomutase